DPLLLHQAAGEVEVGLAVLDAIVPLLEGSLEVEIRLEPDQHLLEDVGHALLLEDPALGHAGQPPELGHELHAIRGEPILLLADLLLALADPDADAVEVALALVAELQMDRDLLVQELVERDVGLDLGDQVELEAEELGDALVAREPADEEQILPERR